MKRRDVRKGSVALAHAFACALACAACSEHVAAPRRAPLAQSTTTAPDPLAGAGAIPFAGTSSGTTTPPPEMPRPGVGGTPGLPPATSCAPIAAQLAPVPWVPPNPIHHLVCTAQEASIVASCFILGGQYCAALASVSPACQSCAIVPGNSATYGALVQMDQNSAAALNVPGCVSAMTGDISPNGCGPRLLAENDCEVAACGHCDPTQVDACLRAAAGTTCAAQAAAATCADGPLTVCLQGNTAVDQATHLIAVFCMQ